MLKGIQRFNMKIAALGIAGMLFLFISCAEKSYDGSVVMVRASAGDSIQSSSLVLYSPDNNETLGIVLTEDFFQVASPDVSYDGESVLFEGRRNPGDLWQIWELQLKDSKLRMITDSDSDCRYPAYLPGDRIVYSRYVQDEAILGYHVLETCQLNGDNIEQITFAPVDYRSSMVLRDGRILAVSQEVFPEKKKSQLAVMRPDGTKIELFYEWGSGQIRSHRGCETEHGLVMFTENKKGQDAQGSLVSVLYNRPLGSRQELDPEKEGDFLSVSPAPGGGITACYRTGNEETYGLYLFEPGADEALKTIYREKEFNILDAVWINPRQRPKKLPSAVDPEKNTALLMCQDANFSGRVHGEFEENGRGEKAAQVELLGVDGALGKAELEKDGSVYLKVAADTPFRIQTLDSSGSLVEGPSSWINLRPNERRGCVGCHAGHERVPENRQPLAVQKAPVEIPVFNETIMANAYNK